MLTFKEGMARSLAADSTRLEKRLRYAMRRLPVHLRAQFQGGKFDFQKRRVLTEDRHFCLQWSVRLDTTMPASRENPQTELGAVEFMSTERSDASWRRRR